MNTKQFVGASIDEVLRDIRAELGDDAVILHTRKVVKGGLGGFFGKEMIEVTATDSLEEGATAPAPASVLDVVDEEPAPAGAGFARQLEGRLDTPAEGPVAPAPASAASAYARATSRPSAVAPQAVPELEPGTDPAAVRPFPADAQDRTQAIIAAARAAMGVTGADAADAVPAGGAVPAPPSFMPAGGGAPAAGPTISEPVWQHVEAVAPAVDAAPTPTEVPSVAPEPIAAASGLVEEPAPVSAAPSAAPSGADLAAAVAAAKARLAAQSAAAQPATPVAPATPAPLPEVVAGPSAAAPMAEAAMTAAPPAPPEFIPAPAQVGPVTTEQLEAMLAVPSPAGMTTEPAESPADAAAPAEPVLPEADEAADDPYPALRAVRDELAEAGVEPRYLDPFIAGFRRNSLPFVADDADVRDAVRRALASRLPVARDWKGRPAGQALAFVGQSGVGKSTVVRKLTWRMHQAGMTVGVICAGAEVDSQVASLAERMGLAFTHAPDAEALAAARREMSDVDILLIDTPGCSHMNLDEMEELGRLLSLTRVEEVHLVLPVAIPTADLGDLSRRFRIAGVNRLTLTKLDETRVHGNLVNVPLRLAKPLAFLADGTATTAHLIPVDPAGIADVLLP